MLLGQHFPGSQIILHCYTATGLRPQGTTVYFAVGYFPGAGCIKK